MTPPAIQPFTASRVDITESRHSFGRAERARSVIAGADGALAIIAADANGLRRIDVWVGDDLAVLHAADRRPERPMSGAICTRPLLFGAVGSVVHDLVGEFPDTAEGDPVDLPALADVAGKDRFPSALEWLICITAVTGSHRRGWLGASDGRTLLAAALGDACEPTTLEPRSAASGWLDIAHTVALVAGDHDHLSPSA